MTVPACSPAAAPPLPSGEASTNSSLQAALRGGPRPGEDWDSLSLLEVCLGRIEAADYRGAASVEDDRGNRLLVVTDAAGHRLAATFLYALHRDNWVEAGARRNRRLGLHPVALRRDMIDKIADGLRVRPSHLRTLAALFAEPYESVFASHQRLNTALGLWWQARLDDGYSVESAATMLGLLAHPTVAARLTYRRTDGCPRLG